MTKKISITVICALSALSLQAQNIVEQWTFDGATPQTGINGMEMGAWDPALTDNSAAGGVLTWGEVNNSNVNLAGGSIDVSTIDSLTLTLELADIFMDKGAATKSQFRLYFGAVGGQPELEINVFGGGQIAPDIEFNGDTGDLDVTLFDQDDFAGLTPITMVTTWDFANNQILFSTSGTGGIVSDSIAADLSGITQINSFQIRRINANAGDFMAFDTVTISTVPEPSAAALLAGVSALGFMALRRRRA
jgi:hypothetical protein